MKKLYALASTIVPNLANTWQLSVKKLRPLPKISYGICRYQNRIREIGLLRTAQDAIHA